jgi:diketogulonate reductase-like aldo/keto reductase
MISFLLKYGVAVIPKTSNLDRLKENYESLKIEID